MDNRMKEDWDARARVNARFYIASSEPNDENAFDESGRRDVEHFFAGLDHLLTPSTVALDIGCGIGRMDRHVAGRVGRLTGLDVSKEMVSRARERLSELSNVEFIEGDGYSLDKVPSASIDLVFSHIVFQHIPRKVTLGYFTEVFRVLAPGGSFVFQVPEEGDGTPADPPDEDTFEMRFYDETRVAQDLEREGFEFVGCVRHPVKSPAADFNQLRLHLTKPR
jgi:SAM-dependent methyltransferase